MQPATLMRRPQAGSFPLPLSLSPPGGSAPAPLTVQPSLQALLVWWDRTLPQKSVTPHQTHRACREVHTPGKLETDHDCTQLHRPPLPPPLAVTCPYTCACPPPPLPLLLRSVQQPFLQASLASKQIPNCCKSPVGCPKTPGLPSTHPPTPRLSSCDALPSSSPDLVRPRVQQEHMDPPDEQRLQGMQTPKVLGNANTCGGSKLCPAYRQNLPCLLEPLLAAAICSSTPSALNVCQPLRLCLRIVPGYVPPQGGACGFPEVM